MDVKTLLALVVAHFVWPFWQAFLSRRIQQRAVILSEAKDLLLPAPIARLARLLPNRATTLALTFCSMTFDLIGF
jgi:hypothetical protein